jgi:hypothetical protein
MAFQVDWRKVTAGSIAVLLHILLILALLIATQEPIVQRVKEVKEIMLTLALPGEKKEKKPGVELPIPIPSFTKPESESRSITVLPTPKAESSPEGDIRALGRYLNNCSGQFYEQLTATERSHCVGNLWNGQHREKAPLLGQAKPSPYDQVLQERQTPADSGFHQCDPSSINASLHNVPCTDFSNSHSILNEVPDQH